MRDELKKDIESLQSLEGWMTTEKGLDMAEAVLEHKPVLSVELGVFGGRSLLAMALALRENGAGKVYGIDPWKLDAAIEGQNDPANDDWWRNNINLHDIHKGCMEAIWRYGLDGQCAVIRAKSYDVVDLFPDGSINMLHQDSNHSELVSGREVEVWHKKLASKGVWILDDADWPTQQKTIQLIESKGFKQLKNTGRYIIFQRTT